jgi:hypothetical protein
MTRRLIGAADVTGRGAAERWDVWGRFGVSTGGAYSVCLGWGTFGGTERPRGMRSC